MSDNKDKPNFLASLLGKLNFLNAVAVMALAFAVINFLTKKS